jgi:Dehydrogenases with different specificities (related to short-chain alcohol dehydrogenases)
MSATLAGKVALVTGGTKGIGRAIVRRFAAEGAQVFYCAPHSDGAATLEREIAHAGGVKPLFIRADVGEPTEIERFVRAAAEPTGAIDIVVNNAAIPGYKTAESLTLQEWDRIWAVNVRATWLTAKFAWKYLRASRAASIVTISSVHARHTSSSTLPYSATKAALLGLTRSLAIDGGPHNIRANVICPGLIHTAANANDFSGTAAKRRRLQRVLANEALGRMGQPEDVAGAALYLAGPDSAFVTGTELFVDGGAHARLYGNVYEEERREVAPRPRRRR